MGDVCSVKVAARRDASEADCIRLQQLAQQVSKYLGGVLDGLLPSRIRGIRGGCVFCQGWQLGGMLVKLTLSGYNS